MCRVRTRNTPQYVTDPHTAQTRRETAAVREARALCDPLTRTPGTGDMTPEGQRPGAWSERREGNCPGRRRVRVQVCKHGAARSSVCLVARGKTRWFFSSCCSERCAPPFSGSAPGGCSWARQTPGPGPCGLGQGFWNRVPSR